MSGKNTRLTIHDFAIHSFDYLHSNLLKPSYPYLCIKPGLAIHITFWNLNPGNNEGKLYFLSIH